MTASLPHAVAPVSAVCAAFAAQPSAYPPEASKPDVAPPCRRTENSTKAQRASGSVERGNAANVEHVQMGRIWRFWAPRRESRINGWRRNRRFSCSQQPAVRTVSRGCAGAAIGACLEKNKRGWHQKSRKRRRCKALRCFASSYPGYNHGTPKAGALPAALHPDMYFSVRQHAFAHI